MATAENDDLMAYCLDVAQRARRAAGELTQVTGGQKQQWLRRSAQLLQERSLALTEANHLDIKAAPDFGLTDAQVDRLRLTPERIEAIGMTVVDQLRQLADGDFSDAELAAATAPVVEQYQYVDNGQFLTELIRLALDPDYDVDEYVYEDATEVDRAAVAEWLATHVDIDQYVAVVTTPRS